MCFEHFPFLLASQQQQQELALPPKQTQKDAGALSTTATSKEPQEETPMEQENPEGTASTEPNSEDAGEKEGNKDTDGHAKMPEHPGRDSDSDGESADEQEQ